MKSKMKGALGVALTLVLLATLTAGLSAVPVGADPGKLKFDKVSLPEMGKDGRYVLTPGDDVGSIATSLDGNILFACMFNGDPELMKSVDGGYTWKMMDGFRDAADAIGRRGDTSPVMDIVTSPEYADDNTVFVATEANVYQSVNGGEDFSVMTAVWGTEDITDLDVTIDKSGRLALIIGTENAFAGDVYVYAPATTEWRGRLRALQTGQPTLLMCWR